MDSWSAAGAGDLSSDCESLPDIEVVPPIQRPILRIKNPRIPRPRRLNQAKLNGCQAPASPAQILQKKKRLVTKNLVENFDQVDDRIEIQGEHPLNNSLVVDQIQSYLSSKELKICRRVNKLWSHCAAKHIGKSHPPIVFWNTRRDEFKAFIKVMSDTSNFPFTRFQIDSNCNSENIPWFFKCYGSKVLHLVLSYKDQYGDHILNSENLQLIIKEIKNVETLELNCLPRRLTEMPLFRTGKNISTEPKLLKLKTLRFDEDYEMCYSVGFLHELFYISPNCVKVQLNLLYDPVTISRFFTSMRIMRKRPEFAQLEVNNRLQEIQIQQLTQSGVKLKYLKLENVELVDEAKSLRDLLACQSETLESLYLCVGSNDRVVSQAMPVMKRLRELSVYFPLSFQQPGENRSQFPLIQDSCLNQFPNLSTMKTNSDVFLSIFLSESPTYANVHSLTIKVSQCDENSLIRTIVQIFPQLKHFSVVFSSALIGTLIFRSIRNLEHLQIDYFGFENINEILTGGSHQKESGNLNMGIEANVFDSSEYSFGIRNMKNLRSLNISSVNSKMTDTSVCHGFLQLPRLTRLTLVNVKISEECIALLEERHDRVEI